VTSALVFGGTFDPVHHGHLAIARQARAASGAEAVWFVPAALAPLRDAPVATPEQRFELLVAATEGEPGLAVLDIALRRGGVSYTADLMEALRAAHPDHDLAVLIGADAARTIPAWHRSGDLLNSERFVIVNRTGPPPLDPDELRRLGFSSERATLLTVDSPDISASEVRTRCARGEPLDGLVPERVASLIAAKGIYRQNRDDA
jgi:nicotinate-nucleotide adenylyltransferase